MRQFRPRITERELAFLVQSLRTHQDLCKKKEKEMDSRLHEIESLKRLIRQRGIGPELNRLRELRKENHLKLRQDYYQHGLVAHILRERFRLLLEGKRKYSEPRTTFLLGSEKV